MLSIQEMTQNDKVQEQLKLIERELDSTSKFHPDKCSILKVDSPSLRQELKESIRMIPLAEFLAKSSTTGLMGAAYLVPDKLHDDLVHKSGVTDVVPHISAQVVNGWKGADALKVDIVDRYSFGPRLFSGGGAIAMDEADTMQATITPKSFGMIVDVGEDLLEDSAYELIQHHVDMTARAIGEYASELAITDLKTGTDGWGTVNSGTSGDADETKLTNGTTTDIVTAFRAVAYDKWNANTLLTTGEAWGHSISMQATPEGWSLQPPAPGFHAKIGVLDTLLYNGRALHAGIATDADGAAFTNCISVVFDRNAALLTGRKRWMQLERYSNPIEDVAGVAVTCRQDSVTLYDDSIYVLTET